MDHTEVARQVAQWLQQAEAIVAFTGAGISTESGIPDFRSPGGVWATSDPVFYDDFLRSATSRHEYWRQKALTHQEFVKSKPNAGHTVLARWHEIGLLFAVITQNIDGLHQEAGTRNVIELHGTARKVSCLDCHTVFEADPLVTQFLAQNAVPDCPSCHSSLLKHATISFGQNLDPAVLESAVSATQGADLFLAIGSSLVVEPAASLPRQAKARGARLVIINRDPTPQDEIADAVIHESIGQTLTAIDRCLQFDSR